MNTAQTQALMLYVAKQVVASEPLLTEADLVIGDGDHGIGMERGFLAVIEMLEKEQLASVDKVFIKVGSTMMASMGGASGAIFGSFFRAGGKALKGTSDFDAKSLPVLIEAGLQSVMDRGGASPGDKTMIDAADMALQMSKTTSNESLESALSKVAEAAKQGVEATKSMIATTGKAKTLGERSLGHPDPGAITTAIIFKSMADFVKQGVAV
ncbi:dihydroxyacetone kinase subunit L [Alginatibacterium sediminis]|uniref:Dihydroxyacetone kinase subunit L n=1 Tax=Alginatibacterium sediminis TaxID=2164068 RepID=A0A420EII5_9ALTE|nr:dihydroxyacetone kinase subunit L [Alginatibacterium sediminis]